jgi:hypothetical protein
VASWRHCIPSQAAIVTYNAKAALDLTGLARDLTLSGRRGAYEYGTREPMPGIAPRLLPEG